VPVCGDGLRRGVESCDDGNVASGDGCSAICVVEDGWNCGTASCQPVCGDGQRHGGEVCDDGNVAGGDGCSPTCAVEDGWNCAGGTCLPVCGDGQRSGDEGCDDLNLVGGDGCSSTCQVEVGWECPVASLGCSVVCGDGRRLGAEGCDDGNGADGDGCSSRCTVEAGWDCSGAGCAPVCGDGARVGQEACDDGNPVSGDGCSASCVVEDGWSCAAATCQPVCGDGQRRGGETCDDGNVLGGDGCSASCVIEDGWNCAGAACQPVCGDGQRRGDETCDDLNLVGGDGCSSSCRVELGWQCPASSVGCTVVCGDGRRLGGEACDDGNRGDGDGCSSSCTIEAGWDCSGASCAPVCGDGARVGREVWQDACDDGNATPGDGCSSSCAVEPGWWCDAPGACRAVCGDGVRVGPEACDDGNTVDGDGCSSSCQVDAACGGPGAPCPVVCGDGVAERAAGEACDDGARLDGDGCSSLCAAERGWDCSGARCVPICGDRELVGDETCDDGNVQADDGCNGCALERGWSCGRSYYSGYTVSENCGPVCGDGLVRGDEECDDHNVVANDGCSNGCRLPCQGPTCPAFLEFGLAGGLTSFGGCNLNVATHVVFTGSNRTAGRFNVVDVPYEVFGEPNALFADFEDENGDPGQDLESDSGPSSISTLELGTIGSAATIGGANKRVLDIVGFTPVSDFMLWGGPAGNTFRFDAASVERNATSAGALDVYVLGTFRDTSGVFPANAASLRLTANQTSGGALAWSATFMSPPQPNPTRPVTVPVCGDGYWARLNCDGSGGSSEECDDGNLVNGDGCDAQCHVEACAPDSFEYNDSPGAPTFGLTYGVAYNGTTNDGMTACGGDDDYYAFDVRDGDRLRVEVESRATPFGDADDVDVEILTPTGVVGAGDWDARSYGYERSDVTYTARSDGRHLVHVFLKSSEGANPGNAYTLRVTHTPRPSGGGVCAGSLVFEGSRLLCCPSWEGVPVGECYCVGQCF
jgi:cysteine-rich repeat protein